MSGRTADPLLSAARERILAPLARVRSRARLFMILNGLVRLALAFLIGGAAQFGLDYMLRLPVDQRAVINVMVTLAWMWVAHRYVLRPLMGAISDLVLAAGVDRAYPHLADGMSTAVQFIAGQTGPAESSSPQLVRAVIAGACEDARRLDFMRVLNYRRARRSALELSAMTAAVALAWLVQPGLLNTWFARNWLIREIPWPQRTYIRPVGEYDALGVRRAPRGDELVIQAGIEGETPNAVTLHWWTPSGRRGRESMIIIGRSRAEVSLGPLTETLAFSISGGDERTPDFSIVPVDRPQVVRSVATITPPEYTGLSPASLEQQTVLEVLDGSTLELAAEFNKPVRTATLSGGDGESLPLELTAPDAGHVTIPAPQSGAYLLRLVDLHGYTDRQPLRYTLKVQPDSPPVLKLELQDVGEFLTPNAEVRTVLTARDVYGVQRVSLLAARGEDPPRDLPLPEVELPRNEVDAAPTIRVERLYVRPGDKLRIWSEAADSDPRGPNVSRSEAVELGILSPTDFLAVMAEREQEQRREFERLISEQRGLKEAFDRLLPALARTGTPAPADLQRLAGLSRQQRLHASRCDLARRGFEQILAEMRTNRVARTADERRLIDRVAEPLRRLAEEFMPEAADTLAALRQAPSPGALSDAAAGQDEILRRMADVLANMQEAGGFHEAVALLQEILGEQRGIHEDTLRALEKELDAILGLDGSGSTGDPPPP